MIEADELLAVPLFASTPPVLRERVAARSAEIVVAAGEWVTREGDAAYLWTILSENVRTGRDIEDWRLERKPYPLEKPASPGSSQPATCAARRSNASPRPSAKAAS